MKTKKRIKTIIIQWRQIATDIHLRDFWYEPDEKGILLKMEKIEGEMKEVLKLYKEHKNEK